MSLSDRGLGSTHKRRISDNHREAQVRKKPNTIRIKVAKNVAALGLNPFCWTPIGQELHREGIARMIYNFHADFLFRNHPQPINDTSERVRNVASSLSAQNPSPTVSPLTVLPSTSSADDAKRQASKTSALPSSEGRLESPMTMGPMTMGETKRPMTMGPMTMGETNAKPTPGQGPIPSGATARLKRRSPLAQGSGWFKSTPAPWFNSIQGREENDEESEWRTEIWNALEVALPSKLIELVEYGDVRGVYARLILHGAQPKRKVEHLQQRLSETSKGALSANAFLDTVRDIADQLSVIGHPPSGRQLTQIARRNLTRGAFSSSCQFPPLTQIPPAAEASGRLESRPPTITSEQNPPSKRGRTLPNGPPTESPPQLHLRQSRSSFP